MNQWWALSLNQPLPATKFDNPLNFKLRAYYPGISLKLALQKYAEQELSRLSHLKQTIPIVNMLTGEDAEPLLVKASQGIDLSKEDSQSLEGPTLIIDILTEITRGELFQALLAIPLDTNFIFTPEVQNRVLGTPKETVSELDTMAKVNEICKPKIANLLQSSVADDQSRNFKVMLLDVQAAAKRVASRLVALSDVAEVVSAIDNAEFDYEDSATQELERFKNSLRKPNSYRSLLGKDASANEEIAAFLMIMGTSPNSSKSGGVIEELCDKISVSTISDYALSALGRIGVSWFTVSYPNVGIGIIAHELGHVSSFKLREIARRNQKSAVGFLSSLECVANRNPFILNPVKLGVENTPWSEEDWADHFSTLVLNELERSNSNWMIHNRNKGCALVTNLDVYVGNGMQPFAGDPHSSGFLRLLMIGNDRRNLDPVCKPFLKYAETASRNLICSP